MSIIELTPPLRLILTHKPQAPGILAGKTWFTPVQRGFCIWLISDQTLSRRMVGPLKYYKMWECSGGKLPVMQVKRAGCPPLIHGERNLRLPGKPNVEMK